MSNCKEEKVKSSYDSLGASASKAGLHDALQDAGASSSHQYFANLSTDFAGDKNFRSFIHCDGAGTKSIVSYLAEKELGSTSYYRGLAEDALVMNLDDVYCLGPVEGLRLSNLVNRNTSQISDKVLTEIISSYMELQKRYDKLGVHFELSGGETADCGDVVRTLLVDAILAGRINSSKLLNCDNITPGDVIVGLSGGGKASWESKVNSGIGSNGLTLARHSLLSNQYATKYPEILNPEIDSSIAYNGPFSLADTPEELLISGEQLNVAEALLSPTRSFSPILNKIYDSVFDQISACIHVTGGGLTKVLRFGKGNTYVKNKVFEVPGIFQLIQKTANIDWKEMYQVFNMGQRLEIYCKESAANEILAISENFNISAQIIGHVEANSESKESNKVVVESEKGSFTYKLN